MDDYLSGQYTAIQIGNKYGFSHRRLREWFREAENLTSFEAVARKNINKFASAPKSPSQKIKIRGFKNLAWHDGKKLETRNNWICTVLVRAPDHPDASNGYIPEHRLIMERHIGRRLRDNEVVHHIDLDPTNNEITNLLLCSPREHALIHLMLQIALTQLMEQDGLRELSHYILRYIRENIEELSKRKPYRKEGR